MSENPNDLGRQEPRGCRFVYGDPGGKWHFCQRRLADGARPGDPAHPPYCPHHTKTALTVETDAARRARIKFLDRMAQGDEAALYDEAAALWQLVPVDVFVKTNSAGAPSHD